MHDSFLRLGLGIGFAVIFVYLLMAVNFQSWLDPFIILMALPGAFAGILWMLFITQTTFSVPSLMGTIMAVGVATANSILLVTLCQRRARNRQGSARSCAFGRLRRLRPVCMTALAMIIGMVPMALALGRGRRAKRAAWSRGDWRTAVCNCDNAVYRADLLLDFPQEGASRLGQGNRPRVARRNCRKMERNQRS